MIAILEARERLEESVGVLDEAEWPSVSTRSFMRVDTAGWKLDRSTQSRCIKLTSSAAEPGEATVPGEANVSAMTAWMRLVVVGQRCFFQACSRSKRRRGIRFLMKDVVFQITAGL